MGSVDAHALDHAIDRSGPVRVVRLVRHPGEEYIYILEGPVEIHTEFYEPVVLQAGESIYIDSTMGHAYVVPEGCEEALVLGVCSSAEEDLMESLMTLHSDATPPVKPRAGTVKRLHAKR